MQEQFLFVYSLDYVPGIMDSNGKMFGLFSMTTFVDVGHLGLGELIELGTHATYGFEDKTTAAWVEFPSTDNTPTSSSITSVRILRDLGNQQAIVEIPRYQEFTTVALSLIHKGARFRQIARNEIIVIYIA